MGSWPKFLSSLPSLSCCFWVKKFPGCESFLSKVTGGTRILLFYECLPFKTATFFPNKKVYSCNPLKKRVRVEPEGGQESIPGLEVRKDILENAKMLILQQQRENSDGQESLLAKISDLEKKIDLILRTILKSD